MVDLNTTPYMSWGQNLGIDQRSYEMFDHESYAWTKQVKGSRINSVNVEYLQNQANENSRIPYDLDKGSCHGFRNQLEDSLGIKRPKDRPITQFTNRLRPIIAGKVTQIEYSKDNKGYYPQAPLPAVGDSDSGKSETHRTTENKARDSEDTTKEGSQTSDFNKPQQTRKPEPEPRWKSYPAVSVVPKIDFANMLTLKPKGREGIKEWASIKTTSFAGPIQFFRIQMGRGFGLG